MKCFLNVSDPDAIIAAPNMKDMINAFKEKKTIEKKKTRISQHKKQAIKNNNNHMMMRVRQGKVNN